MYGKRLTRALVVTTILSLLLTVAAFADQFQSDKDTLTANTQSGALNLTLGPGDTETINVGAVIESSGGANSHVAFSVPVTAQISAGTILGTPSPTSGSISDYGSANEFSTEVLVTAPSDPDSIKCNQNNGFVGKILFTATDSADADNLSSNGTVELTVNLTVPGGECDTTPPANVVPAISWTANPSTANEGNSKTYNFSITDSDSSAWTFVSGSPSCGTGGSLVSSSIDNGAKTGTFDCSFPDGPANPTVSAQVSDGTDVSNTLTQAVVVSNVKPSPSIDSIAGSGAVACVSGNTITLGFSWSDPAGTSDTYSYDVNWGDGNHTQHTTADLGYSTSPLTGMQHSYSAGTYTISVTVNDEDAGTGTTVSSASGAVSFLYSTSGILQPVNDTQAQQDPSVFKYGSTLPIKIRITDCNLASVGGLSPLVTINKQNSSPPIDGADESITNTNTPDSSGIMRYDAAGQLYIYNLATKSLQDSTATYKITITASSISPVTTLFGTRAK